MRKAKRVAYFSDLYFLVNNKDYNNRCFAAYYYDYGQWSLIGEFCSIRELLRYIKSDYYSHIFSIVFGKRVKLVYRTDDYFEYEVVYLESPGEKEGCNNDCCKDIIYR